MPISIKRNRGSILIWSLLLGLSLATVFFFFSQRLNQNTASQRETIQYQNARLFMESYVDYVKSLNSTELADEFLDGNVPVGEGVTGTLSNVTEVIYGSLDADQSTSYKIFGDGTEQAKVEWDHCDDEDDVETLEVAPNVGGADTDCPGGDIEYDSFAIVEDYEFTLTAGGAPVNYRIIPMNEETILYDNEWQLDLEMILGPRKRIVISESFIPES